MHLIYSEMKHFFGNGLIVFGKWLSGTVLELLGIKRVLIELQNEQREIKLSEATLYALEMNNILFGKVYVWFGNEIIEIWHAVICFRNKAIFFGNALKCFQN